MIIQNRFKVLDKVGQGAFGRVYKAIDAEKKRFVALKLLDKAKILEYVHTDNVEYVKKMIESEGNIIRKCNHKNIVECYGIYENEDFKIIVTRFCENGNL